MRIEYIDIIYEEHSVEGLDEELDLFPGYQGYSNFCCRGRCTEKYAAIKSAKPR